MSKPQKNRAQFARDFRHSLNDEMKEEFLIFFEGFMMAFKLSGLDTVDADDFDILDGYMDYSRRRLARPKVEDDK